MKKIRFPLLKRGIAMVDYVLIVSLVSVIAMGAISSMSDTLFTKRYSEISSAIDKVLTQHEMDMRDLENRKNITAYSQGQIVPVGYEGGLNGGGGGYGGSFDFSSDYVGSVESEEGQTTQGGKYGSFEDHNNHLPEAKFKIDKNPVGVGIPVEILNLSTDPEGCRIVKVDWGTTYPTNNMWTLDGVYELKLRVADEYGNWSNWYKETVTVTNDPPIAKLLSYPDFGTLTGKDLDMATEGNVDNLFLIADDEFKIHLVDNASYDPDGHTIVESTWTLNNSASQKPFGEGLHPVINQSGTYTATLKVKDSYNKSSEVDIKTFYVFASDRPVINGIRISDGSNGELSEENLDSETWISELFPYQTGEAPKLPGTAKEARINFDVTDDSDDIIEYQLRINDNVLTAQSLSGIEKNDKDFYLGAFLDLTTLNVSGTTRVALRVKDSTGTWSYWSDDITIDFIDINNYVPEISNVTLSNYSYYTNSPFQFNSPYYTGPFLAEIKLEDPYGNSRTVDHFDLTIGGTTVSTTQVTKVAGNRYKVFFTFDDAISNATFTITGRYGTGITTNTYEITPVTIEKTKLTFSAEFKNSKYPDWWKVSLTGGSSTNISVDTEESGNAAGLQFNINYVSPFKANITEIELKLNGQIMSFPVIGDDGNGVLNYVRNFESSDFPDGQITMSMRIKDDMGNYSDWSNEKTFNSLKIATYTPKISNILFIDYRNQVAGLKRGNIRVEMTVEDFFALFRLPNNASFTVTPNNSPYDDAFVLDDIVKVDNQTQRVFGHIDTTDWITQKGEMKEFNYSAKAEYAYPAGKVSETFTGKFTISAYDPNSISNIEYKPLRNGEGNYIITYSTSSDANLFDITKINLTVVTTNADGSKTTHNVSVNAEDAIFDEVKKTITIAGPQIEPHIETPVSAYLEHNNFVANSNTVTKPITIYKPYPIEFVDVTGTDYHRAVNTDVSGYSKLFAGKTEVNNTTLPEPILFDFNMSYKDKKGQTHTYKSFEKVYISPRGGLIFANADETIEADILRNALPSSNVNVVSETFGHNTLSILNGDYKYYNNPTAANISNGYSNTAGIYYKVNTREANGVGSLTVKYINVCSTFSGNRCTKNISFEMTLYENGSAIFRYGNNITNIANVTTLGARIVELVEYEDGSQIEDLAYGQLAKQELAGKSIRMNLLPTEWKLPPYIYKITYEQADGISIDEDGEVIRAHYTVYYKNPDNAEINGLEATLQQRLNGDPNKLDEKAFATTQNELTFDIPGENISFDSDYVILRGSTDIVVSARLKYNTSYYSAWYTERDIKYIGPTKVEFEILPFQYHIEPTSSVSGYTYQPMTTGIGNYCDDHVTSNFVDLGFEMDYFGEKVSQISISSNSLIRFRTNNTSEKVQNDWTASPVKSLRDDTIALLWYDQDFRSLSSSSSSPCGIFTKQVLNPTGSSYLSIKFVNMTAYHKGDERFTYEVRIYQNGEVRVHYSAHTPVKFNPDLTNAATTIAYKKSITDAYGSLMYPVGSDGEFSYSEWTKLFARYMVSYDGYEDHGYFYFNDSVAPSSLTGYSLKFNLNP